MDHEEIKSTISAMSFPKTGKYDSKLDFDQRCEILALYRHGIGRATLAEAYGIDRRTVTHIYNPKSVHYRSVRAEEQNLGIEQFQRRYLTENALVKLKGVQPKVEPKKAKPKIGAKRSASRYAGVHMVETDATSYPHRISIAWQERGIDGGAPGWYYMDADGPAPEQWFHNGEDSIMTSQACYEAIVNTLVDV
jgi:hypothetical protein